MKIYQFYIQYKFNLRQLVVTYQYQKGKRSIANKEKGKTRDNALKKKIFFLLDLSLINDAKINLKSN